ncbi:MAG: bifunctional 5,10-methylenetetrahydrofolate dehydrogenase/5,10-methenyltetrahydrofolate cyclohydrolase [Bacilli bacterium]|nr:bifunctional 5,10-methylenetetrahydrofolate dehydrogenase/5,10-methenyltetrahydrofolate cyclohydrolase [Bacilli bacterium]
MKLIDGKKIQTEMIEELNHKVSDLMFAPKLVIIQVGDFGPSNKYVAQKKTVGEKVGIDVEHIRFYEDNTEEEILNKIDELNEDPKVNGIMVQLPLPKGFDEDKITNRVSSKKDVDGLTTENIGLLFDGKNAFTPCTALGVMELFKRYNIDLKGKHAVILGRSKLVGKPLIACLLNENATVTVCHSKTENLSSITKKADILIVAIGKKHFVTKDMIKKGTVIIDVGINVEDGKIYGDVNFDDVKEKASFLTPVPNGVGRMTVISLMNNVIKAYQEQSK